MPSIKDPIPNQDSTIIINEKYPILPPLLWNFTTEYKPFFNDKNYYNKTEDENNDSKYSSPTEINDY